MQFERQRLPLKALGQIVTGKTPPTEVEGNFGGEIPFLTPSDFEEGRRFVTTERTLSAQGLSKVKSCLVPYGVAVSCIGWQMGKSVIVTYPTVTNQQINTIVPDLRKVDMEFLYYYLVSLRRYIFELGATSTRTPIVNKGTFGDIEIELPPIREQRRIAEPLSILDQRIENLRELNSTLESIAQAIFKSWFIDFDPVRAKAEGREPEGMDAETAALFSSEFEESELGPIPRGWRVRSLDSFTKYLNGLALQKYPPESDTEFLPVIKIAQLRAGNTTGADRASTDVPPDYVVRDGDVLFSWSGSLEVEIWCGGEGALNQHLFKVTSDEVPKWWYYLATKLHLPSFREIAAHKATTMGHIQRKHLTEAKIALPTPEVLRMATSILEPLLERRVVNALQARQLADLRDALLPRLISGQLRVPEAEIALEEALI